MRLDKITKGRTTKSRIGSSFENKKNVSIIRPKIDGAKDA